MQRDRSDSRRGPPLEAGTWYAAEDLFEDPVRLGFGRQYRGRGTLAGGVPVLESDWTELRRRPDYPYCALSVEGVDESTVFRMPDALTRGEQLLRHSCWKPPGAAFGFEARLRVDGIAYRSQPTVVLDLTHLEARGGDLLHRDRQRVVADAHRQGLLDNRGRSRADFRIYFKQLMQELDAMLDSGYVPEHGWRASAVYGGWQREDGDWVLSPFDQTTEFPGDVEIGFFTRDVRADLKVSDLFSRGLEASGKPAAG